MQRLYDASKTPESEPQILNSIFCTIYRRWLVTAPMIGLFTVFVLLFTWLCDYVCGRCVKTGGGGGGGSSTTNMPVQVTIGDIHARTSYTRRWDPRSLHIGQRKLLMNEIQFLTTITDARPLIVYAGAAPGNKTGYLSELFPNMTMLLVDPNPFDIFAATPIYLSKDPHEAVSEMMSMSSARIFIINDIYTSDLSRELAAAVTNPINTTTPTTPTTPTYTSIRFISDIRTGTDDVDILWNHAQQYAWIHLLSPESAMLKFRMPYYTESTEVILNKAAEEPMASDFALAREFGFDPLVDVKRRRITYFDGEVRIQPWAPLSSTETRLIVTKVGNRYPMHTYTNTGANSYENIMHGYNTLERDQPHVNDNANLSIGFDHCNDCALENLIWKQYIASRKDKRSVLDHVNAISKLTHRPLLRGQHGKL